jgi:hypothetical protein
MGLGIEALSRGVGCIRAERLIHELVQPGKVTPVEGIDEALDNGSDVTRGART